METTESKSPGRPPIYDKALKRYLVSLTKEQADYLFKLGGKNRSGAVRDLIEWHKGERDRP